MIPFNRAAFDNADIHHLQQAVLNGHISGNGPFTRQAEHLLNDLHPGSTTLLTTSCTHALEASARLLNLRPGDEVIVPAYTFISTASAFVWNGARPVFADIRLDTLNIDPASVETLITDRTRAICIVHYAGVGAQPDLFAQMAAHHGIALVEDNAHGLGATWNGQPLGTFGDMSTLSFHETKNITCGEGGALVIKDPALVERAEILREKGTDRSRFLRGQVDKYTWVDIGSSWVMSDLLAAILVGQLERFDMIQHVRQRMWDVYGSELAAWAKANNIQRPLIPTAAAHSSHMYYLRVPDVEGRDRLIEHLRQHEVMAVFHYQDLRESPVGRLVSPGNPACPNSEIAAQTVVRLPLYSSLSNDEQSRVIEAVQTFSI